MQKAHVESAGSLRAFRRNTLLRAAADKFTGAWLACFLVMSRGDFAFAFSLEHARIATICGAIGAALAVALLAQMDLVTDTAIRHATISGISTFVGDVVSRPMHSSPYWLEPALTGAIAAAIAFVVWHAKRRLSPQKSAGKSDWLTP